LLAVSAFSCDITLRAVWSMQQELGASIEWVQAIVPFIWDASRKAWAVPAALPSAGPCCAM
jgi:hypothetical protein